MKRDETSTWRNANFQDFWAEIAPTDHLVQVYENEMIFLNTLEGFVGSGFLAGDTVIIIATENHLTALNERLIKQGFHLSSMIKFGKYIPLDAHKTLSGFMISGWPDEILFFETVNALFNKAKTSDNKVRAFGEMVAILWEQGHNEATVRLEHLWNKFCETQQFCLYCAYPKSGFTNNPVESIMNICCTHSKVIGGWENSSTEIHYDHIIKN